MEKTILDMVCQDAVAEIDRLRRLNHAMWTEFRNNEKQLYNTGVEKPQNMKLVTACLEAGELQVKPEEHPLGYHDEDATRSSLYALQLVYGTFALEDSNKLAGAMLYKARGLINSNGCYNEVIKVLKSAYNQIKRQIEQYAT